MKRPITIFYVYAEADERLRQQLEIHLALLLRQGMINSWQQIQAGVSWAEQIEHTLREASLILLLISSDFLASDICEQQMQRALERHRKGEVQVIPILLRPAYWKNAPFAYLQVLPTNKMPMTIWANPDEALAHVTEEILHVLEGKPLLTLQHMRQDLSLGRIHRKGSVISNPPPSNRLLVALLTLILFFGFPLTVLFMFTQKVTLNPFFQLSSLFSVK